eukprot:TRINITY_DN37034_c0_g1_i1.p2 TRINITY_DN37034_c0_g1~~TRINITY_DN37034_c0_g1_i1.p2  ORF type:complete len:138 (+),score=20.44 TRINITY_DN37034_c0_g1_i1:62-475(+)
MVVWRHHGSPHCRALVCCSIVVFVTAARVDEELADSVETHPAEASSAATLEKATGAASSKDCLVAPSPAPTPAPGDVPFLPVGSRPRRQRPPTPQRLFATGTARRHSARVGLAAAASQRLPPRSTATAASVAWWARR